LTMARRSLAHNFQAMWYRAAIMALCWPATPSEVKFAADSPLVEAVTSELVSETTISGLLECGWGLSDR